MITKQEIDNLYLEAITYHNELAESKKLDASKLMVFITAGLDFLVWCSQHLYDDKGKISIPIWKWLKIIAAIRKFLSDIKKV